MMTTEPRSTTASVPRDHLFISYAWEDQAFAKWLALRLTAEGYKVWIDQFKLLGGESWPRDIDVAIKTHTFRVLGVLSRSSIAKPNPLKERTLALNIAKQPGRTGFLIPLNLDGLRATELDWLTSDITFIAFWESWRTGLNQLLKLLDREGCPTTSGNGKAIVSSIASASELVVRRPDHLASNISPVRQIPNRVATFLVSPTFEGTARSDAQRDWAYYSVSPYRVLAFHPPGEDLRTWLNAEEVRSEDWRSVATLEGVDSTNVVVALLRRCAETRCRLRGLGWSPDSKAYYFAGKLGQDLPVRLPDGAKTTVQHSGQRTFFRIGQPKVPYRYRLAVVPRVERGLLADFAVVWKLRLHLTDAQDAPLPPAQRQSRRKHATRNWFNRQWLVRHLAVAQYLAGPDGLLRVGPEGERQVVIEAQTLAFQAGLSIDEAALAHLQELTDDMPAGDEGVSEDEPVDGRDHG